MNQSWPQVNAVSFCPSSEGTIKIHFTCAHFSVSQSHCKILSSKYFSINSSKIKNSHHRLSVTNTHLSIHFSIPALSHFDRWVYLYVEKFCSVRKYLGSTIHHLRLRQQLKCTSLVGRGGFIFYDHKLTRHHTGQNAAL